MSRIIVALDAMPQGEMFHMASRLKGLVWGFKVNDALLSEGCKSLDWLSDYGKVFYDPKLHDIPNTVKNQVRRLIAHGADLITCHASGGVEMLQAAVEEGGERIIAVTALTSLSDDDLNFVYGGYERIDRPSVVRNLADVARQAKCWGVVCAPTDLEQIPVCLKTVTPGFRPEGISRGDDQKHIGGADQAKNSTLVVVGRPITKAADPVAAVNAINSSLEA